MLDTIHVVNSSGPLYRLGDAIRLRKPGAVRHMMNPRHAGSIGQQYIRKSGRSDNNGGVDYDLLMALVECHIEQHNLKPPAKDCIVMHYRTGDMSIDNPDPVIAMVTRAVLATGFRKLEIVTAMHNVSKSSSGDYGCLCEVIRRCESTFGIDVVLRSDKSPDADFCHLVKAPCLITTKGNFSLLAYGCSRAIKYSLYAV